MKLAFAIVFLLSAAAAGEWEKISVPTSASLRGLSVVSQNVIWASGTEGTVLRTLDGGKSWSAMAVPGAEKLDFRGIRAFDDATAVIISSGPAEKDQARIYRTADGGATWKQVFAETRRGIFLDAIAFWDRKHGIVLSDPPEGRFVLFATDDGGLTWRQVPSSRLPPALPNEGAFAASNSCLAIQGEKHVWFATGGASVARVFRSNDRGQSWSVAETPMQPKNASSGIFSLAFQDALHGVAVGGDYAHPESSDLPNVLVTSDGGKSWQAGTPTKPPGMYFSSAAMAPGSPKGQQSETVFAVGTNGIYSLFRTRDGSWVRESEANLNTVDATAHRAWAVGPKGMVLAGTH